MFQLLAIITGLGLFEFAAFRHGVDSREDFASLNTNGR